MIFPNEIIEIIIGFSHPIEIANCGSVCRDWYTISNSIQFCENRYCVKSTHLLSLWYHILANNNRNKNIFTCMTKYSLLKSHQDVVKYYINDQHLCIEMFNYFKVFRRTSKHNVSQINFFMFNETMYITFNHNSFNLSYFKTDVIRVVHSLSCPVSKRVKYFSRNFDYFNLSDLKKRLLSYHYRKNLTNLIKNNVEMMTVCKNFIVCSEFFSKSIRFYTIDTTNWKSNYCDKNENVPLDYHLSIASCEKVTNLACTIHPIVHTIAREPHSVVLFSPINGEPFCIRRIRIFELPKKWMSFCNDPNSYVLDKNDQFHKIIWS